MAGEQRDGRSGPGFCLARRAAGDEHRAGPRRDPSAIFERKNAGEREEMPCQHHDDVEAPPRKAAHAALATRLDFSANGNARSPPSCSDQGMKERDENGEENEMALSMRGGILLGRKMSAGQRAPRTQMKTRVEGGGRQHRKAGLGTAATEGLGGTKHSQA